MSLDYYKNKKVYIVGITGVKGTWLTLILKTLGADVYGMGLRNLEPTLFDKAKISDIATVKIGDITEDAFDNVLIKDFCEVQPDVIFNLLSGNESFFDNVNTNVLGTTIIHEVLCAATLFEKDGSVKKFSYVNVVDRLCAKENKMYNYTQYCSANITREYRSNDNYNYLSVVDVGHYCGDISDFEYKHTGLHVFDAMFACAVIAAKQVKNKENCRNYRVDNSNHFEEVLSIQPKFTTKEQVMADIIEVNSINCMLQGYMLLKIKKLLNI